MKVLETHTIFNDEKSTYFHRLVLKGRRSPIPSGGPPKGLQSAAVTLVASSWRVESNMYELKLGKYKVK